MTLKFFLRNLQSYLGKDARTARARVVVTVFLVCISIQGRSYGQSGATSNSGSSETDDSSKLIDLQDCEISPDDLLYVNVFDVPELSRDYRASPNGSIEFPALADPIPAAGLTPTQLSHAIRDRLIAAGRSGTRG